MSLRLAIAALLLGSSPVDVAAKPSLSFRQVASGVFFFEGRVQELFASERGHVSNVVFVVGEEAVAVIDTGATLEQGILIRQAIERHTQLPIAFIINTHVHLDHIFGNGAFQSGRSETASQAAPSAQTPAFLAHSRFPLALAAKGRHYQTRLAKRWGQAPPIVAPTRLIKAPERIDLGGRALELIPLKKGHTDHDLVVWDVKTRTLIAGDAVFEIHCPVIDGSLLGWRQNLVELRAMQPALLIPGHGPARSGLIGLDRTDRYLAALEREVRKAVQDQVGLHAASRTLAQAEAARWKLCEEFHPRNIITAYAELEWE